MCIRDRSGAEGSVEISGVIVVEVCIHLGDLIIQDSSYLRSKDSTGLLA